MVNSDPHLPEDILIEIFTRLPAKSVGKCRCLSKSWCTRLSTSQFIKSHLDHRKNHQESLILADDSNCLRTVTPPITDNVVSKELGEGRHWAPVLGSCNGLVLLETSINEMFVVNLTTRKKVYIRLDVLNLKGVCLFQRVFGFGYDHSTDDYKIVITSYYYDHVANLSQHADVYSLKLGAWRSIDSYPITYASPHSYAPFVGGAMHWLTCTWKDGYRVSIVAFNVADDVFGEIPGPANVSSAESRFHSLSVLGGCLSMVESFSTFGFHVWVMKEYGSVASWTKYFVNGRCEGDVIIPLCFLGDKEILFMIEGKDLVVYHVEKETTKTIAVDGCTYHFSGGATFVDSLVSPSQREPL